MTVWLVAIAIGLSIIVLAQPEGLVLTLIYVALLFSGLKLGFALADIFNQNQDENL